jgi:hypothetical protein
MRRLLRDYSFAWVTGVLFLGSLLAQLLFQATEFTDEALQHGQDFTWDSFWAPFGASVFENWQSEFLQLLWQVAGLRFLLYVGSSQSKDNDEQMEARIKTEIRADVARVEAGVRALLRERGLDQTVP